MGILNNLKFAFSEDYAEIRKLVMESGQDLQDLLDIHKLLQKVTDIPASAPDGGKAEVLQRLCSLVETLSRDAGQIHEDIRRYSVSAEDAGALRRRILERIEQVAEAVSAKPSGPVPKAGMTDEDVQKVAAAVSGGLKREIEPLLQPVREELRRIQEPGRQLEAALRQEKEAGTRFQQEASRYAAENVRLTQELKRAQEECVRFQQEASRQAAENARLTQELKRAQEEIRKNQEHSPGHTPSSPPPPEPFVLTKNQESVLFRAGDKESAVRRFCNTAVLDRFFQDLPENDTYQKLYQRFRKKLDKIQNEPIDPDSELEDILGKLLKLVHAELLKKMVVAVYRARKGGQADFENRLLPVLNQYLSSVGFYTRNDLRAGRKISDEDYQDMEFLVGGQGAEKGTITEIELYPYYINFLDEDRQRRKMHTQGTMIIAD